MEPVITEHKSAAVLRIAVVGAGLIGRRHIGLIRQNPQTQLCAVIDPTPAATELAVAEGVPYYPSLENYFSDCATAERPDGAILATPNSMHVAGALACLEYGVPALIEKPVADNLAEADQLVAAQAAGSVPLLVGHHRRHSAILAAVREAIVDGRLGKVVTLTGTALFHKPDHYFSSGPWRAQPGGGPLLINLIHEIDGFRYLLGEVSAVQAMSSNAIRGFAVEDSAAIILRFACGALATFTLSDTAAAPRSWEQTSGEDPAYPQHDSEDCYFITGTQASIAVPTMRMWSYEGERSWWQAFNTSHLPLQAVDPMARQLAHFCDVIRRQVPPLVSVKDAAQSLRVTLAIIDAARSGATITLEHMQ